MMGRETIMFRLTSTVWLLLANAVLVGCSNWHHVDLAQLRQQRLAAEEDRSHRTTRSSRPQQEAVTRAPVIPDDPASTGSIGPPRDIKPWPKVGTPEWHQLQAEEAERERRVQEAIQSICQGC